MSDFPRLSWKQVQEASPLLSMVNRQHPDISMSVLDAPSDDMVRYKELMGLLSNIVPAKLGSGAAIGALGMLKSGGVNIADTIRKNMSNPAWLKKEIGERIQNGNNEDEMRQLLNWLSGIEQRTGTLDPNVAYNLRKDLGRYILNESKPPKLTNQLELDMGNLSSGGLTKVLGEM